MEVPIKLEQIPIEETYQFVSGAISSPGRVLEVGCGNGLLAARLIKKGFQVVAVDQSREAVEAARSLGIDARRVDWLNFWDDPFDGVLFTRSLHHIQPLQAALNHARTLLKPGGLLLVEDFAYSDMKDSALRWFYQTLLLLKASGLLRPPEDGFVNGLLREGGAPDYWQENHGHDLHSWESMLGGILARFRMMRTQSAPYLYRYLLDSLPDNDRGRAVLSHVLSLEKMMGQGRKGFEIGRRLVAKREENGRDSSPSALLPEG